MIYRTVQGCWETLGEAARRVREAVFIKEQGVPTHLEHDGRDSRHHHAVVFVNDIPAATGRLDSEGRIGRVAVLSAYRRHRLGTMIMQHLEAKAQSAGLTEVMVHAQAAVIPFYEALGYVAAGDTFMEAGIFHQRMIKRLA
ncbi:MAG: GNAT family N-acetyltransferase [Nitrospiria bacterium]